MGVADLSGDDDGLARGESSTSGESAGGVTFEPVEDSAVSDEALLALAEQAGGSIANTTAGETATSGETTQLKEDPDEYIRVSIVLDGDSALDAGYSVADAGDDEDVQRYREGLLAHQQEIAGRIEELTGEPLDVEWNLTLVANIISANVKAGMVEAISGIDGVSEVLREQIYQPLDDDDGDSDVEPSQAIATSMTGATKAWSAGYTGAGMRIAVIDTGIDTDHISFSEDDYVYSLEQDANAAGQDAQSYIASLDLLDAEEVSSKLGQLNSYSKNPGLIASDLYVSDKIPFAFNYADRDADVTHDNDSQGDHGSHVSGIAAANRYVTIGGTRYNALDKVKVAGNAPDAQIIVLKVFGKSGGTSTSDYMAAIEDAIVLGADSINLSLGSTLTGFSTLSQEGFDNVLSSLEESDVLVSCAAGNEGYWAEDSLTSYPQGTGYLYADDVNYDEMGEPASVSSLMAVASVDNAGTISDSTLTVANDAGSHVLAYTENIYNNMRKIASLDSTGGSGQGTEYGYVLVEGSAEQADFEGIDVSGKIVFCSRGGTAFYEKASLVEQLGAAALIVYNNVSGIFGMDMTSYTGTMPCISITQSEAVSVRALSEEQLSQDNDFYYTGTIRIDASMSVVESSGAYKMSEYSSWGTTGDLALKPEITTPGGSIRSVKGDGGVDEYKLNSGTSMASPQVAGISALVCQYIQEEGLEEATAFSCRQISQSLIMSTAQPLKDDEGNYYSLLQQGAGLANADDAVSAGSFVIMGDGASQSASDGKVKAELGDDPARTGVYTFDFTIYNVSQETKSFALSGDVFTQDAYRAQSKRGSTFTSWYQDTSTCTLSSDVSFSSAGQGIGAVTVDSEACATVTATITLTDEAKAWLEERYARGAYIQAFVYAEAQGSQDGAISSSHSIPVLAFWGNWTDPSMFDGAAYKEGEFDSTYSTSSIGDRSRSTYRWPVYSFEGQYGQNHLNVKVNDGEEFAFGGNPIVADASYDPGRNAMSSGTVLSSWSYDLMRDSVELSYEVENLTTGQVYVQDQTEGKFWGSYIDSSGYWQGWGEWNEISGEDGYTLPEGEDGDVISACFTALPEYYRVGKAGYGEDPGSGAKISISATLDNTSPYAVFLAYDSQTEQIEATLADENYVAAAVLYDEEGKAALSYAGSDPDAEKGSQIQVTLSAEDGKSYLLQVYDYAMNSSTYSVEVDTGVEGGLILSDPMIAYDLDAGTWVNVQPDSCELAALTLATRAYSAASAVGDEIYAVAYGSELYRLSFEDLESPQFVCYLKSNVLDLAYNPLDGCLYGITDQSRLLKVDLDSGKVTKLGKAPVETNTLACDADGVFYSHLCGTGEIYSYTLASVSGGESSLDLNGDGVCDLDDVQVLLDYSSGVIASIDRLEVCDLDANGQVDSRDAALLLGETKGYTDLVCDIGISSDEAQAMEFDLDNGRLWWTSRSIDWIDDAGQAVSFIYEIDVQKRSYERHADLDGHVVSLVMLDSGLVSSGSSSAGEALGEAGMNVEIRSDGLGTVTVRIAAGGLIENGQYSIRFDASKTNFTGVQAGEGVLLHSVDTQNGEVDFAFVASGAVHSGQVIAEFSFRSETCDSLGSLQRVCDNASYPQATVELDLGNHSWGEWSQTVQPTCSTGGQELRKCSVCGRQEQRQTGTDGSAHSWGNWSEVEDDEEDEDIPAVEMRECELCGQAEYSWAGLDSSWDEPLYLDHSFSTFKTEWAEGVSSVRLHGAYIDSVRYLYTYSGAVYMIGLGDTVGRGGSFGVHFEPTKYSDDGYGNAIKEDKVGFVGDDADETDYTVQLVENLGALTVYSYTGETNCVPVTLCFYLVDGGMPGGSFIETGDYWKGWYDWDAWISELGVWNAEVASMKWRPTGSDWDFEAYVRLDDDTAADASVWLEFIREYDCSVYSDLDPSTNIALSGMEVRLENGVGKCSFYSVGYTAGDTSLTRHYTVYFTNHSNHSPELSSERLSTARCLAGSPYSLDLTELFSDPDLDKLSYSVSVDGGESQTCEAEFSTTFDNAGTYTLVFTASDGLVDSPEHTLTLVVWSGVAQPGDVNADGKVNALDVTALKRYLVGWKGVDVDAAGADVNADGKINALDVTVLKRYLVGWKDVRLGA